jgi:hypothetical protein
MSGFKKAVKSGLRLRMAITGPSGSGKTYTALRLATAMGLPIAFIDTEHRSASKYADLFDFDVVEMQAPFHPKRFVEGIKLAQREGYKCVVIDSLSHAWNGPGGILELVEDASARIKGNSYAAWKDVTPFQNDLIEAIVGSDIHIIATMRSKMDYVQQKDDKGYTKIQKVGMAPIQRDGFEYEFDVVMDMDIEHRGIISKTRCPALTDGVYKFPGESVAEILSTWLNSGAAAVDIEKAKQVEKPAKPEVEFLNKPERTPPVAPVQDDGETPFEKEVMKDWRGPLDAQNWAVENRYCKDSGEAMGSWKKATAPIAPVTPQNMPQAKLLFLRHQLEKVGSEAVPA